MENTMGRRKGSGDKAPEETIKLPDLPRALLVGGCRATYTQCYNAVIAGDIPAYRSDTGNRWLVNKADVPKVIENFSLLRKDKENG